MRWRINNSFTSVEGATPDEASWLRACLSYKDTSFRPGKRGRDRSRSFYNPTTDEFPTGLGSLVWEQAKRDGVSVEVVDERRVPTVRAEGVDLDWLKTHPAAGPITHQMEAVEAAVAKRRGLLWVPTGGGKTEIAAGIVKALPCRWLFLVHRGDLLAQTAARYEKRTGLRAGVVGDGKVDGGDGRFVVATFQTMYSALTRGGPALDILRRAEGLLIDEAHAVSAETFFRVSMAATEAYFRIGLSGTPLARGDEENLSVIGATGRVIYRVRADTLINLGLLALPKIRMVEVPQVSDRATWQQVYKECVVESDTRNAVVVDLVRGAAKPSLVFVQHVDHGKRLLKLLSAAGLAVEFVWGQENLAKRQAAIQRLVRSDIEVLIVNVIFQEGVDIPSLRSVVMAAGGASTIATLQRAGRGMRADASTSKTTFEVHDIYDRGCGCRPDSDIGMHAGCKWLERHSLGRIKALQDEGFSVEIEKQQRLLALSP